MWWLAACVQLLPLTLVSSKDTQLQGWHGQGSHDPVGGECIDVFFGKHSQSWFEPSGALHLVASTGIRSISEGQATFTCKTSQKGTQLK